MKNLSKVTERGWEAALPLQHFNPTTVPPLLADAAEDAQHLVHHVVVARLGIHKRRGVRENREWKGGGVDRMDLFVYLLYFPHVIHRRLLFDTSVNTCERARAS